MAERECDQNQGYIAFTSSSSGSGSRKRSARVDVGRTLRRLAAAAAGGHSQSATRQDHYDRSTAIPSSGSSGEGSAACRSSRFQQEQQRGSFSLGTNRMIKSICSGSSAVALVSGMKRIVRRLAMASGQTRSLDFSALGRTGFDVASVPSSDSSGGSSVVARMAGVMFLLLLLILVILWNW
mmetsp:Transcript_5674/g.10420  ORF Transcript_5674/g.10420 Transcript_5674/m.10420 type:complete len:181 (-) Transcript_5674:114-656(-)